MAKLWMWDRLFTLMRLGDEAVESTAERREWAGDCEGPSPEEGPADREFVEAGSMPDGVGCEERGWKRGLGGVGACC